MNEVYNEVCRINATMKNEYSLLIQNQPIRIAEIQARIAKMKQDLLVANIQRSKAGKEAADLFILQQQLDVELIPLRKEVSELQEEFKHYRFYVVIKSIDQPLMNIFLSLYLSA